MNSNGISTERKKIAELQGRAIGEKVNKIAIVFLTLGRASDAAVSRTYMIGLRPVRLYFLQEFIVAD
jgi:hypothetical protein